jgi:hypothetical protein
MIGVSQGPTATHDKIVMDPKNHWNEAYATKAETMVSWFQAVPARSLAFITTATRSLSDSIIDIGGGTSRLVDALIVRGYSDLSVLDVSPVALDEAKARLGVTARAVSWILADVTRWRPERTWRVWHDRAAFHFLTDDAAQMAYIGALKQATEPGAAVILATFALTGPTRCSGLPVQQYSPETLADRLGPDFALCDQALETHVTPSGLSQDFSWAVFRREGI